MFEVVNCFQIRSVKMYTPKRKRNLLDFKQKREIIDYAMKYPKSTLEKRSDYFSIFGELLVKRRTVGDILSNKETYDSEDDQRTSRKQDHSAVHADIIYKRSFLYVVFVS